MSLRTKVILWISGTLVLIGLVILIWAIDTNRISIFASEEGPTVESASQLQSLPSPDQSTFSKIFTAIIKPFTK